jgi:hypothetical protein
MSRSDKSLSILTLVKMTTPSMRLEKKKRSLGPVESSSKARFHTLFRNVLHSVGGDLVRCAPRRSKTWNWGVGPRTYGYTHS